MWWIVVSNNKQQVSKVIWQKASSPTCPRRWCEWIRPILTPSNTLFLGPTRVISANDISIGSAVFAWLTLFAKPTKSMLYNAFHWAGQPIKVAPFREGSQPPSNTWFLRPTRHIHPNGTLIGSAVFAGLTNVTNRQTNRQTDTDHATPSVAIARILCTEWTRCDLLIVINK